MSLHWTTFQIHRLYNRKLWSLEDLGIVIIHVPTFFLGSKGFMVTKEVQFKFPLKYERRKDRIMAVLDVT